MILNKKKEEISFTSALLLGINVIIGSGIFLLPGSLYQQAGIYSLVAILFAGVSTLLIALNYAVMSSKIDEDGGAWIYANTAFGPDVGFQVGWFTWFLGVITISTEIAAFLTTLKGIFPVVANRGLYIIIATVIIGILAIINLFGPGATKFIDNISSTLKISMLLVFVIGGLILFVKHPVTLPNTVKTSASGTVDAFTTSFYMFTGFSFLPIAAKEMRNAEKNLPRALITVILGVTAIYLLTQFITMFLLGSGLVNEKLPVAIAFEHVVGAVGKMIVLGGMLVSTLGVAIAVSFDSPVELASLSTEKDLLPAAFGKTNRFQAPILSVIVTAGLAIALVASGSYLFLVNLIVFSSFIQYIATILALLKLRKDPDLPKGMHLMGGDLVPLLALLIIVVLFVRFTFLTYAIGIVFAIIGGLIYLAHKRAMP